MHFYLKAVAEIFTERKTTKTRELKTRFCVFKLAQKFAKRLKRRSTAGAKEA